MITPMILEDYEIVDIVDTDRKISGLKQILKYYPKNTKFIIIKIPKDEADLLKERAVNVRRFYNPDNTSYYGLSLKIRRVSDIEIVNEHGDSISYEDFVRSNVSVAKIIKNTFKVILYECDINEKHVANFILGHARITIKF